MTTLNLERRMLLAALVWLVLAWGLGGTALSWVFRTAVVDRFDSKLQALAEGLADDLRIDDEGLPALVGVHPNFEAPDTGWYWVLEHGGARVTSVPAPALEALELPSAALPEVPIFFDSPGPGGVPMRAVTSANDLGVATVTLTVLLDRREIDREITSFSSLLAAAAALLGVILLVGILVQARFALAPLRRLRADLAEVEAGRLEGVPENYPSDIRPVAEAINGVLERDQALASWARKSAGNLAHALKTELAVLRQLASEVPGGKRMVDCTERISGIVEHHLSRATIGPSAGGKRARADTRQVVAAVVASLERIFAHRAIAIQADVSEAPDFRGEQQDLEEIVGNLLENACRHARTEIRARAFAEGARLVLCVEDDGEGLAPGERALVMRRGERLDERGPGAGLGLSIVGDLTELYGGSLELGESSIGSGLAVRVDLPAVAD